MTSPARRNTLAFSEIIGSDNFVAGTFCIFHTHTQNVWPGLGSHLAERGYVSYRYRSASLRHNVHGNLDAIARLPDQSLQLLGGESVRRREFNLQLAIGIQGNYELGVVNPTLKRQKIVCRSPSMFGKLQSSQTADLPAGGTHLFRVTSEHGQQRIGISSRLIMARPLVFHITGNLMDVFHG